MTYDDDGTDCGDVNHLLVYAMDGVGRGLNYGLFLRPVTSYTYYTL